MTETETSPGPQGGGSRLARAPEMLFWVLLAAHLGLVVWTPGFPTQDGPVHLSSSAALGELLGGDPPAVIDRYFEIETHPSPTWGTHLFLALLHTILPPGGVEKLAYLLYVLALPLAARAVQVAASRPAWQSLIVFPFVFHYPFHMGFYSYSLSLAAFLLLLALWIRREAGRGGLRSVAASSALLAIAHPVTWVVGAVTVGCLTVPRLVGHGQVESVRRSLLDLLAAVVPGALVVGAFAAGQSDQPMTWLSRSLALRSLVTLDALVSFDRLEILLSMAWAVILAISCIWIFLLRRNGFDRPGDGQRLDPLLWAAGVVVVLYFLAPNQASGGGWISVRLALSGWLLMAIWLATRRWSRALAVGLAVSASTVAFCWLALHADSYMELDLASSEIAEAARRIEPGTTLLPLVFTSRGEDPEGRPASVKVRSFGHIGSRLAVENGLVDLTNYQAMKGYFPVGFRPEVHPESLWQRSPSLGPFLDIGEYHRRTEGSVDYVLVWGYRPGMRYLGNDVQLAMQELASSYDPVYVSEDRRVFLFRRRADDKQPTTQGS